MVAPEADEVKRKRILEGARTIFFREGISSLTMGDIAAKQGISKKTLYKYFASKADLVQAALEDRLSEVAGQVDAAVQDRSLAFPARMGRVLGIVGRQLSVIGDRLLNDLVYREPKLWERIDRFRREKVFAAITRLFEEGVRDGFVRTDIESRLVPELFLSSLMSTLNPAKFFVLNASPVVIFRTIMRVLMTGILTEEGRSQLRLTEAEE